MAKKGQTFNTYSEELKREVVRLKLEEGWSYRQIREHLFDPPNRKLGTFDCSVVTSFPDQYCQMG
jgi:hypothetical protein